jgi:hypothetical protein
MELELKLLKQKQEEEEKSGGVAGLFVDEKTTGQHLVQLKEKYQKMRKELDKSVSELTQQKNEVAGDSTILNQQLGQLTQQYRKLEETKNEAIAQGEHLLTKLESEHKKKYFEHSALEQQLHSISNSLSEEKKANLALKTQNQIKEMEDKIYQENLKHRIAQQEKLVQRLGANLDSVIEETVNTISNRIEKTTGKCGQKC